MLVYNVTVKVDAPIADEWLHWMMNEHAPEQVATQCFSGFTILRLLDIDDAEGPTFAVQYFAENKEDYQRYLNEFAEKMSRKSYDKWGQRFIAFRTAMEVVK